MNAPDTRLEARWRSSPNHEARANGAAVDLLILHYTGMASAEAAWRLLCDPAAEVSCHYLVDGDGSIVQMVAEGRRAWHAGVSSWHGESDVNSRSIGIEIQNPGHDSGYPEYPEAQMAAVIALARDILARHPIPPERVLAHSDVAPARKLDPGEKFDWRRLHAAGIGHWVEPVPIRSGARLQLGDAGAPVAALQGRLAGYGYGYGGDAGGRFDAHTRAVVAAFQRHWRPERVDGIADPSTIATLDRLIQALPAPQGAGPPIVSRIQRAASFGPVGRSIGNRGRAE